MFETEGCMAKADLAEEAGAEPAARAAPKAAPQARQYVATFTANRSFEAHVGGRVIAFGPYESVAVDEGTVSHSDFKAIVAAGLLQVKEVSK
jgi:deoxyribodipyrimidine photolyase-like uncharacterized protein